jgi:hypothetical protein
VAGLDTPHHVRAETRTRVLASSISTDCPALQEYLLSDTQWLGTSGLVEFVTLLRSHIWSRDRCTLLPGWAESPIVLPVVFGVNAGTPSVATLSFDGMTRACVASRVFPERVVPLSTDAPFLPWGVTLAQVAELCGFHNVANSHWVFVRFVFNAWRPASGAPRGGSVDVCCSLAHLFPQYAVSRQRVGLEFAALAEALLGGTWGVSLSDAATTPQQADYHNCGVFAALALFTRVILRQPVGYQCGERDFTKIREWMRGIATTGKLTDFPVLR